LKKLENIFQHFWSEFIYGQGQSEDEKDSSYLKGIIAFIRVPPKMVDHFERIYEQIERERFLITKDDLITNLGAS
jgi:hypothetical protein